MSSKLVFTVPDTAGALAVVNSLKDQGLTESEISVIGNDSQKLDAIPDAGEFSNDVKPAAKRGAAFGGATGLLAGVSAALALPGLAIGGAALALATAGGATFGVLASALIGSSVPNSQVREYEDAIGRGELLIVVEVDDDRAGDVARHLHTKFPELELKGEIDPVPPVV
jgi:hypothetical protein